MRKIRHQTTPTARPLTPSLIKALKSCDGIRTNAQTFSSANRSHRLCECAEGWEKAILECSLAFGGAKSARAWENKFVN
jgi:hypothetical protein